MSPFINYWAIKNHIQNLPYASQLFGNTPEETFTKAKKVEESGFKAVKFGWGPFGKNGLENDVAHLSAAREGLGENISLMVDAGTVWNDVDIAEERLISLKNVYAYWLEEPFINLALDSYKKLSESQPSIPLAGGEGCNNFEQAKAMIQYAGISFIQIDTGRIGGITVAKNVTDLAQQTGITYVNHTFTSHLALSASLQPFAGIEKDQLCEYPVELTSLAQDITQTKIVPDDNGYIHVPEQPGLGITVDTQSLKKYLVDVEIKVNGNLIYYTPELCN